MARKRLIAGLGLGLLVALGLAGGWYGLAEHRLRQAEQALQRHDHRTARQRLAEHLKLRPGHARAHFLAARVARRLGLYDEAAEHLKSCARLGWGPESVELERLLADVQQGVPGVEAEVRQRLEEVEAGSADEQEVLEVLIQHYLDGYRLFQALQCLNRYLRHWPSDLQALLGRAYVHERLLYFGDALVDYRLAVEHHPDSTRARLRLAETLLIAGTPAEALEQFRHLHEADPEQPAVRLGLARSLRRLGRLDEARGLLDDLLERPAAGADRVEALWERGQLARDEGQARRAEACFREAARLAPHDRKVHHSLAQCLRQRGARREADQAAARVRQIDDNLKRLQRLTQAVLASPDDAGLRCQVGLLFLENGQEAEGLRWLRQALHLDPGCLPARRALAEHARRPGSQQP
jgi:tetratricopeptide (TPR) repeat protein